MADTVALTAICLLFLCLPGWSLIHAAGIGVALGGPGALAVTAPAGLAIWIPALAVGMAAGLSLTAVLALVALVTAGLIAAGGVPGTRPSTEVLALLGAGTSAALLASRWREPLTGDAFFHAGRVRKLAELPEMSLSGVSSFLDGSPHVGYVLPALHAVQAAAIEVLGLDPSDSYPDLIPAFAFLAPIAVYAAGSLLGGRTIAIVAAILAGWDVLARSDGALDTVAQPTGFTLLVLAPATIALIAAWARTGRDRRLAGAIAVSFAVVAVIHSTYALMLLAPLAAGVLLLRRGWWTLAASAGATALVYAAIWAVAVHGGTAQPGREATASDFWLVGGRPVTMQGEWLVHERFEVLFALGALVPLLVVARRRHAFTAALLAGGLWLIAFPALMTVIHELFGAGQARRFWSGLPWPYVAAAALAELGLLAVGLRLAGAVAGLAAVSLVVSLAGLWWLGATPVVIAVAIASAAASGWQVARRATVPVGPQQPVRLLPAALLCGALLAGPVADGGEAVADTVRDGPTPPADVRPRLPRPLIDWFRERDAAPFPVVLGEPYATYQLVGEAAVYAVALPEERTRAEPKNHPQSRRTAAGIALAPGTTPEARERILDGYDVRYVLVNTATLAKAERGLEADPGLREVLRTDGWIVYERVAP